MVSPLSGIRWLFLLVLPSALGLLIFGMVGLVSQTTKLEQEMRDESLVAASAEAMNLSRLVRNGDFLHRLPEANLYEIREQRLVVPEYLGPLDREALKAPAPAFCSPAVTDALDRAALLEFEGRPANAAVEAMQVAFDRARDDEDRGVVLARLAWLAHRSENEELLDQAISDFARLEAPAAADRLAMLGLELIRGRPQLEPHLRLLMQIPEDLAWIHCSRLRDLAPEPAADLEMLLRERLRHRDRLRRAKERLEKRGDGRRSRVVHPESREDDETVLEALDGLVLIFGPPRYFGHQQLALVDPRVILELADVDRDRFVIAEEPPAHAVTAIPYIHAWTSPSSADDDAASGFMALLLLGLALTFVVGLLMATRALHREALAARARTEFLTSVTHELKTPLASIRLIAEMLEMELIPEEGRRQDYYSLLSGETARLSMLIENVLDLGRMERGERAYDRRPEDLVEVVRGAVEVFRPIAQRDGLAMVTDLGTEVAQAMVDRGAIVQALLNLLENSRKYAAEGERISMKAEQVNGRFRLELRDFGPGVPADELESIFERFKRGAAQSDGRIAGVGLGLHLSRRLIEDHGGRLSARQPQDGKGGVVFVVELPLMEGGEPAR